MRHGNAWPCGPVLELLDKRFNRILDKISFQDPLVKAYCILEWKIRKKTTLCVTKMVYSNILFIPSPRGAGFSRARPSMKHRFAP